MKTKINLYDLGITGALLLLPGQDKTKSTVFLILLWVLSAQSMPGKVIDLGHAIVDNFLHFQIFSKNVKLKKKIKQTTISRQRLV